jgi:hypothetical protein
VRGGAEGSRSRPAARSLAFISECTRQARASLAGYVELRRCANGSIEIAYFGLTPDFIGRGFGSVRDEHYEVPAVA